jgi:hypothetical protein
MREFYHWELGLYERNISPLGFLKSSANKIALWWSFYLGPLLTIPLFAFPCIVRDRRMRLPLIALGIFVLGLSLEVFTFPHYFAPATCLLYLVLIQCMRHLRLWRWKGKPVGLALVRAIPVLAFAMIFLRVCAAAAHAPIEPAWPRGNLERARIERCLGQRPGRSLVIVSQHPFLVDKEWVYNHADIDASKIVWARDMGEPANQELIEYFRDREIWMLSFQDESESSPVLTPYGEAVPLSCP